MTKKEILQFYKYAVIILVACLIGFIITGIVLADDIKQLENEVVEAYDRGYTDGENYALFDFMEDYYDVLIENAILKERLDNQPREQEVYEQIVDDFELTLELMQHYYENNITSYSFGDWIQINYPALYQRLLNYY